MFNIKIVRHADLQKNQIDKIIALKNIFWKYPYESQIAWLNNNLQPSDLHLMIFDNENLVAYLNMVHIKLLLNDVTCAAFGVGNVCTAQPGKGYGRVLMNKLNNYILEYNSIGALFCQQDLAHFYKKFNWQKMENHICQIENQTVPMMIFNYNLPIVNVKYDGKLF